jgi:hypothetical protein
MNFLPNFGTSERVVSVQMHEKKSFEQPRALISFLRVTGPSRAVPHTQNVEIEKLKKRHF